VRGLAGHTVAGAGKRGADSSGERPASMTEAAKLGKKVKAEEKGGFVMGVVKENREKGGVAERALASRVADAD